MSCSKVREACSRILTTLGTSMPAADPRSPRREAATSYAACWARSLAQGLPAKSALRLAVCLHGATADALLVAQGIGPLGLDGIGTARHRARAAQRGGTRGLIGRSRTRQRSGHQNRRAGRRA